MTAFIVLCVVLGWMVVVCLITKLLNSSLPDEFWARALCLIVFLVLLPLPIVDEIVGRYQFKELCVRHAEVRVDRQKAAGKTLYLDELPPVEIKGPWVTVMSKPWRYLDVNTGETIVSYDVLNALGGNVLQALGLSASPLTFSGICPISPRISAEEVFKELGIKKVDKPSR